MTIAAWKSRLSRISGGHRHPGRARLAAGVIIALGALLAACASGGGGSSTTSGANGGASTTATTGASATATASSTATPAPTVTTSLPIAFHVSPANTAGLCNGALGSNAPSVYAFSKTIYARTAFFSYPSYAMPSGVGFKPFKLGNSIDSPTLDQIFGGPANANPAISQPGGILFSICNNGSQSVTISGVGVGITHVAPHASPIDTWQRCDGAYQPGVGVTGGGCGGGVLADEDMRATFSSGASSGATASATMIGAHGPNGYGPLPVTLKPGHTLQITVAVTMPTAPGVYTLALTVKATGVTSPAAYAPLAPQLFAATGHKWNGQNCKAAAMLSQIPANATSSYFICPA